MYYLNILQAVVCFFGGTLKVPDDNNSLTRICDSTNCYFHRFNKYEG